LANDIGVDLTTISRAYREERGRGLIEAVTGRGTFVRESPDSALGQGGIIDMSMNHPPKTIELDVAIRDALQELPQSLGVDFPTGYGPHAGSLTDRVLGTRWLQQRLPQCVMERVLICAGVQNALLLFCLSVVGVGGKLLTESLTYPGIKSVAAHLDIELIGISMDEQGMLPDSLEKLVIDTGAKAIYCTPTLHNPTTATMSDTRRREIAKIVKRHNLLLLEDDVYGGLADDFAPPIATYAPDNVFYVTSLSKIAAPALRLGYLVVPSSYWFAQLEGAMRAASYAIAPYSILVTRALMLGGYLEKIINSIRLEARSRQCIATEYLHELDYRAHPTGHHGWLGLPAGWTSPIFIAHLRQNDIVIVDQNAFAVGPMQTQGAAVRIGLGSPATQETLRNVLVTIKDALQLQPNKTLVYG
jgi:DNA-binding transcriptional MocR family regulator